MPLSVISLSSLHLYLIIVIFIDLNNRAARLLTLHVARSLTLCLNGVYIIESTGVDPRISWLGNRRLRFPFY
jgi:hypothetical protein